MDFASSYVLDEESQEDYFDDEALNDASGSGSEDENLSDEEVEEVKEVKEVKEKEAKEKCKKRLRKVRKADTNICSVNLASLAEDVEVFTGEITFCGSCKAGTVCLGFTLIHSVHVFVKTARWHLGLRILWLFQQS